MHPSEEYKQRLLARERHVAHFDKQHIRIGNIRLLIVVATLILAWLSFERDALSPWWLLVPLALFITLAALHSKVLRKKVCAERAANFYRRALARLEDRWIGTGQQGERIDASTSLYATDLDLFGRGSLFELISQARTRMGEDTLASWLLAPASVETIHERHAAIVELRLRLDLREDVAVLADDIKAAVHAEALLEWARSPNQLKQPSFRWLALFLALTAVAAAVFWGTTGIKAAFFSVLIVEGLLFLAHRRRVNHILHGTERALEDLQLLSSLLARLEREQFTASRLHKLRASLSSHHVAASKAISSLSTIVEHIYSLDNPIVRALDVPLLYSVQLAYAAEAWRSSHGSAVHLWLEAVGEIEALLSLAGYSYEHPDDPFPGFVEGSPCFDADELGHPLIPAATCVRNPIGICGQTRVLLISGSNMSGKSTLMRAVGLNAVLAMAGAPVRATRLQLTPLQVAASILINDSLQEGSSRFYAEITRLRHICDLAEGVIPVLFLLDELLQGTNSRDRLTGAEAIVHTLLQDGAIGIISTHDLALTGIDGDGGQGVRNMHLQDRILEGRMKFDFKLHDGVVTKSNGIELMRLIGLKI